MVGSYKSLLDIYIVFKIPVFEILNFNCILMCRMIRNSLNWYQHLKMWISHYMQYHMLIFLCCKMFCNYVYNVRGWIMWIFFISLFVTGGTSRGSEGLCGEIFKWAAGTNQERVWIGREQKTGGPGLPSGEEK